jgi:hypothetical protein
MDAIGNDATKNLRAQKGRRKDARLPVVQRRHGIERMG